jgi:hypothetical protein
MASAAEVALELLFIIRRPGRMTPNDDSVSYS